MFVCKEHFFDLGDPCSMQDARHICTKKLNSYFAEYLFPCNTFLCRVSVENADCYTSQLKYVFRLGEDVSRARRQNSLTP